MAPLDEDLPVFSSPKRPVRKPGQEPLAGYRLVEPLGSGGFGEVWKCVVSGGLHKAIKFVDGKLNDATGMFSAAAQEFAALERVKSVRHPFILSIERIEVINGVLMIVMELADKNLQAVLLEHQVEGRPGIPRENLLCLLSEAAEALDHMNEQHGLQHLDVKPHNLFVIGNHVKVADFGLVASLGGTSPHRCGGLTPLYAAPELYQQTFSRNSDQYSLAIVFQQLLTGTVPFASPDPHQLRLQHLTGSPDLSALAGTDRIVVGRALAKNAEKRYPSCQDFIRALLQNTPAETGASRSRTMLLTQLRQKLRELDRGSRTAKPAASLAARPAPTLPAASAASQAFQLENQAGKPDPRQSQVSRISHASRLTPPSPPPAATVPDAEEEHVALPSSSPPSYPSVPGSRPDVSRPTFARAGGAGSFSQNTPQVFQRTCVVLPGYRFLECQGQNPLGELWTVADTGGKQRLGFCLIGMPEECAQQVTSLQARRHSGLPPTEVFWSPAGRLVLVTDLGRPTLRDCFEECQKASQPGIPRERLLTYLRSAAETLDALAREQKMQHLGLNPGNLLVEGNRLLVSDYGLVPLVWMAGGQPPGQLNPRYAAPELLGNTISPTSDQYSLALIYAEMLSGVYPRLNQPSSRSGQHRRTGPASRGGSAGSMAKVLDLDFLPVGDRDIVSQALHEDPQQRYPSCTAFLDALEAVTVMASRDPDDALATLPLVIPFTSLLGTPPPPGTVLPPMDQVVAGLINLAAGRMTVDVSSNLRYVELPGGKWEFRCPVHLFAGLLRLKLEGFRQHWKAQTVSEDDTRVVYRLVTHDPGCPALSFRRNQQPSSLEIEVCIAPEAEPHAQLTEAVLRLTPFGESVSEIRHMQRDLVPRLCQSLRAFLQATPEQRSQQRWPFTAPLRVYPILPELELAGVIEGRARNISLGGLNFQVRQEPPTKYVYLHLHDRPQVASLALLARILRVQPLSGGKYEVAVTFQIDDPLPSNTDPPVW